VRRLAPRPPVQKGEAEVLLHPPTDIDYFDFLNYLAALLIAALAAILRRWRPKKITVQF
jgi:hypothetical protein